MPTFAVVAAGLLALALLLWRATRPRRAATDRTPPTAAVARPVDDTYRGLREQAFTCARASVGGIPTPDSPDDPWCVVMDWGVHGATVTVLAMVDGSASIYFSTGGGHIGGQGRPPISAAAQAAVRVAAGIRRRDLHPAAPLPALPAEGETRIYVRTDEATSQGGGPTQALGEGRHPLSPLFLAMQEVITQYRLLDEARKR